MKMAKEKAKKLMIAGQPQQPAGPTKEVTLLEVSREKDENLMDNHLLAIEA